MQKQLSNRDNDTLLPHSSQELFDCNHANHHAASLSLANWLEQSSLIRADVRKSNTSVTISITPRADGRCEEQLAAIDLFGRIETRISKQATHTLKVLIAERATEDAAKLISGGIVIDAAVSLLANRVAERAIKQLAGGLA